MKISLLLVVALAVVVGCKYERVGASVAAESEEWPALTALSCVSVPGEAKLLDESGALALFSGETPEDIDSNKARDADPGRPCRNSLFLRRRKADGTDEWRVLMTSGSTWRNVV